MRMTVRLLIAVVTCALLSGCDAFRSFEAACERNLPPTRVTVKTEPIRYDVNRTLSYAALTRKGAALATDGKTVLGLTEATLAYSISVSARGMSSRMSGRYCMRPAVEVSLSFTPMTVWMGADEMAGSCRDRVIWDHELKHVAEYQAFLPEFADGVAAQLRERLGEDVQFFPSAGEGQKHLDAFMHDALTPLVRTGMAEVKARQRLVDSPAEYARLAGTRAACGG